MPMLESQRLLGIDVGSTTVKCVVVDARGLNVLWRRYQRHETRQAETLLQMLHDAQTDLPELATGRVQAFVTGSGAGPLVEPLGARFIQEVNAVTFAVERCHPDVNSVVELGGQDAKIILFKENANDGTRRVITSMNDKCASGTGATVDKCVLKVGLSWPELAALRFDANRLHHVAAKCGVFAETDIVNLIKAGVPSDEVMNSLADAIVMQNLSVLTRGNTLRSKVLLLGGPNTYLPFLQDCWRMRIAQTWRERGYDPGHPGEADALIVVPDNAQYYAAYGAVVFGACEGREHGEATYRGTQPLEQFIRNGRRAMLGDSAVPPLVRDDGELHRFRAQYAVPVFQPAVLEPATQVRGYVGIDGGSTSSKAVFISERGDLLAKEYQLSRGNPLQDVKQLLGRLKQWAMDQRCTLEVLGVGATGYAADVLEQALKVDANIVETVAHMMSAKQYCGEDIDVVCDVGGQDIKVLFLRNGDINNFRLSNQCSAGNGMLLQAMADQFGVNIADYADVAFGAELAPRFNYGCAVFLDTDRVNFQKEGFNREELFAGLAMVLPKNIWQYVVQVPRIAELGRKFVLQGGTQYNLAAVKAQVDYIAARVPAAEIRVHPHCGEAGAIGAALEAMRVVRQCGRSTFVGLDAAIQLEYTTRTDETTRCGFCDNHCVRTFIDTRTPDGDRSRYIAGFSCEMGTVESKQNVVALNQERKRRQARHPNLVEYEANLVFRRKPHAPTSPAADGDNVAPPKGWRRSLRRARDHDAARGRRGGVRIGIPRALNIFVVTPFLRAYLEAAGIDSRNIVYSDETSEELWLEGGKYSAIDPCFPAKAAVAHVHNLLYRKQARTPLTHVWFPCITRLPNFVSYTKNSSACPIVAGTPEVAKAAFTKEKDLFRETGVEYLDDALDFADDDMLRHQLRTTWGKRLGITSAESDRAWRRGWEAMRAVDRDLETRGRDVLERAEQTDTIVLLLLGRPYHGDPGLNHDILAELQAMGYPVLSMRAIPKDTDYLARYFRHDIELGRVADCFDIRDVWPENYSANSAQKVWAAKFAARHPNVAAVDLSSFKCGQDAPTYGIIDRIMVTSRTPYLMMHDIDANKPGGSIKIRIKTFVYSLERHRELLERTRAQRDALDQALAQRRREMFADPSAQPFAAMDPEPDWQGAP